MKKDITYTLQGLTPDTPNLEDSVFEIFGSDCFLHYNGSEVNVEFPLDFETPLHMAEQLDIIDAKLIASELPVEGVRVSWKGIVF